MSDTFTPATPASLPPSGAAGGMLTGTYPNPELGNHTVNTAKVTKANVPATGAAEGEAGFGISGPAVKLVANLNAKAEKGPYTLKHNQESVAVVVSAYNKTKKAVQAIEAMEVVSAEEIKVTFTAAPAAKDEILIMIIT